MGLHALVPGTECNLPIVIPIPVAHSTAHRASRRGTDKSPSGSASRSKGHHEGCRLGNVPGLAVRGRRRSVSSHAGGRLAHPDAAPVPAPVGPDPPDDEAVVVERKTEAVGKDPMPEVVAEGKTVPNRETVPEREAVVNHR